MKERYLLEEHVSASDSSSEVTSRLDAGSCLHLTAVDCEIAVVTGNSVEVVVGGKVRVFFKAREAARS